ncbi:MAG: exopolysaccharide biosynthesis protein [Proteobacteria bacterium]|nr:exopolysaccharide biosynthesis protein [Pseudomonadota bacterium]
MQTPSHDSRRLSDVLDALARNTTSERIRLGDLMSVFGDRAFGMLILLFALPNAIGLGTIPGVSTIFGLPQIFIALQMMLGLQTPWLPAWLTERSIARGDFVTMIEKSTPYLRKAEGVLRPRWAPLSCEIAERIIGGFFVVLATIVSLPIPFGNQPPAVAMAVVSLGLVERDGVFVVIGGIVSVGAIALAGLVVFGGAAAVYLLFKTVFGG